MLSSPPKVNICLSSDENDKMTIESDHKEAFLHCSGNTKVDIYASPFVVVGDCCEMDSAKRTCDIELGLN